MTEKDNEAKEEPVSLKEEEPVDTHDIVDTTEKDTLITSDKNDDNDVKKNLTLNDVFLSLSPKSTRDEVEELVKDSDLFMSYRNNGTGTYIYRIAVDENVAKSIDPVKGSVVTISFYALRNYEVTEITYLNTFKMVEGFWYSESEGSESGYWLADYNDPSLTYTYLSEDINRTVSRIPVQSAEEIIDYMPSKPSDLNLLEQLFIKATDTLTESEVLTFVEENELSYNSRGPGNEKTIAYSSDIVQKYGNQGSYITFSSKDDKVIIMDYIYYPAIFKKGIHGRYYSSDYASSNSLDPGFQITGNGVEKELFDDPENLVKKLHN